MKIKLENYTNQSQSWPSKGHYIMAQYDENEIIVYQSYKKSIGEFAIRNQYFGGEFSYERMTWIKPNFLWMMYRNGWGTKDGQECVLAIHLKIDAFERYLMNAVYSSYDQVADQTLEQWQKDIKTSNVRLQWDPDHDPYGLKLERKAIQIGLRNEFIHTYAKEDILLIEDISDFVYQQYEFVKNKEIDQLLVPYETSLVFKNDVLNRKLKLSNTQ